MAASRPGTSKAPRWRRNLAIGAAALLLLAFAALGIAAMLEERLIFYPTPDHEARPDHYGLTWEDVALTTADGGQVHGWYITPVGTPRAYLLFSHGNAGNISHRLPIAERLADRGLAVLMYDYRGYGHSPGKPSEKAAYADAEAALAWLVERASGPEHVILYGRSLGGGVSWEMASRHPEVAGIITDCTFTSLPDMAAEMAPLPFVRMLVRSCMNNRRRVAEVALPKLLLHGTADELIPYRMGEILAAEARGPVTFVPLPGAGHNDTMDVDPELYYGEIDRFVDEVLPRSK